MCHFLVLEAGKMGIVLAENHVESESKNKVTLMDINSAQLERASEFIKSKRLITLHADMDDERMIDQYDSKKEYTLMAKTTNFPASIAAQIIDSDIIFQRGSLFPENNFHAKMYKSFMEALQKRGIIINHKTFSYFKE